LRISNDMAQDRGLKESPYTQIIASIFLQIDDLMDSLKKEEIPESLKEKLQAMKVELGRLIATAKQGDRPRTYEAAIPTYRKILTLYPEFSTISSPRSAFEYVLAIQSLNEIFAKVAQVKDQQ